MPVTAHPIQPHERRFCAYCTMHLSPNGGSRTHIRFSNHMRSMHEGRDAEQQLEAFNTNRRVVRVTRGWSHKYDDFGEIIKRKDHVSTIDVVLWPENDVDWGYDGIFCSLNCAANFARACHKAGWRMKK